MMCPSSRAKSALNQFSDIPVLKPASEEFFYLLNQPLRRVASSTLNFFKLFM